MLFFPKIPSGLLKYETRTSPVWGLYYQSRPAAKDAWAWNTFE